MNSLITNETTTIGSKNHDNNSQNDTDDTTSTRLTTRTIHSYPMIPIDSVLLIDTWWIALELWYNYTDRYIDAIDVWMNAIQENNNNNNNNNNDMKNSTETTITIDCENGNVSYEKYGMDHLEYEWRKTQERFIQQQDHDDQFRVQHQQHVQISYIQLYIFIAGTLLDAQRYRKARQFLFTAIIHLLTLILLHSQQQRLCTSNKNNNENSTDDDTYYQLLAKALQEYIATYEEEQQLHQQQQNDHATSPSSSLSSNYISSWIIGRRIATLRNTLSLTSTSKKKDNDNDDDANDNVNNQNDNTQSRLIQKHLPNNSNKKCYWNPNSIYQRPPYYIHYRTFIQKQDLLLHNATSTTQDNSWNVYDTPILQRQYHPLWCQQLENHIDIIQNELDQLLKLNNNNKIKDTNNHISILQHWNQVGDGVHRNGTGIHDSSVIRCGDWREYVLFSSHCNHNNNAGTISTAINHTMNHPSIGYRTKQLIQQYCYNDVITLVETGIGEVIFSVLAPKTHILPHTSSHNIRYTAHLPLCVPTKTTSTTANIKATTTTTTSEREKPNCYIRIGEEICEWEVGKMLLFDDSYEHEVVNDSNEIRIVLLIRFWHPLLHDRIDRQNAIRYIEQLQNIDQLERYNPPILYMDNNDRCNINNKVMIQQRRMEQSCCKYCQQTGYTSLRVIAQQRTIICSCGNLID